MRPDRDNFCIHAYQVSLSSVGVDKSENHGIMWLPYGHPDRPEQHLVLIPTSLPLSSMKWEYVRGIPKVSLENLPHGRVK